MRLRAAIRNLTLSRSPLDFRLVQKLDFAFGQFGQHIRQSLAREKLRKTSRKGAALAAKEHRFENNSGRRARLQPRHNPACLTASAAEVRFSRLVIGTELTHPTRSFYVPGAPGL
jgi:hypothetical protein